MGRSVCVEQVVRKRALARVVSSRRTIGKTAVLLRIPEVIQKIPARVPVARAGVLSNGSKNLSGDHAKTAVSFFVNSTLLAVVALAMGVLLKVAAL